MPHSYNALAEQHRYSADVDIFGHTFKLWLLITGNLVTCRLSPVGDNSQITATGSLTLTDLIPEKYRPTEGDNCLRPWYHTDGNGSGLLGILQFYDNGNVEFYKNLDQYDFENNDNFTVWSIEANWVLDF